MAEKMIHYVGELGNFYYNPDEFKLHNQGNKITLRYIGSETNGQNINIPIGIKDCSYMFFYCTFLKNAPIIPDGVEDCSHMFSGCASLLNAPIIPEGVKDCSSMFSECFSLEKINPIPKSVEFCMYMFFGCISLTEIPEIPEGAKTRGIFRRCNLNIRKV